MVLGEGREGPRESCDVGVSNGIYMKQYKYGLFRICTRAGVRRFFGATNNRLGYA